MFVYQLAFDALDLKELNSTHHAFGLKLKAEFKSKFGALYHDNVFTPDK